MPESKPKVINGISFQISQPYEAGHTLTDLEARVLNQTRSENVGNNVRAKIKEMLEPEDGSAPKSEAEIQAYVAEVDAAYVFRTVSEGGRATVDPYEREATKIARELIKAQLAEKGRKLNTVPDGLTEEEWKDKLAAEVERVASLDQVLAAAKKAVDAKKKQANALLEAVGDASL